MEEGDGGRRGGGPLALFDHHQLDNVLVRTEADLNEGAVDRLQLDIVTSFIL